MLHKSVLRFPAKGRKRSAGALQRSSLSSVPCFGLKAAADIVLAFNCEGEKVFNPQPIKGAGEFMEIDGTLTVSDDCEQELRLTTADIQPGYSRQ